MSPYDGHDMPRPSGQLHAKAFDQPWENPSGKLTQNGLFEQAALRFKKGAGGPEAVAVYEKIRYGIWAFNGMFSLRDAWVEQGRKRKAFKFRLEIALETDGLVSNRPAALDHTRTTASTARVENAIEVAAFCANERQPTLRPRLPYSKETSRSAKNIRLLCVRTTCQRVTRFSERPPPMLRPWRAVRLAGWHILVLARRAARPSTPILDRRRWPARVLDLSLSPERKTR